MRISDWSSDVCSSDLSRRRPLARGDELDLLVVGRAENQPVDVNAGQMDLIGIEGAHGHDFLDLGDADLARGRHRLVEVARGLAEQQVARLVRLPALDDRQIGADAAFEDIFLARSEENTSELQSLMRISYAVFCLNKKKKTTT